MHLCLRFGDLDLGSNFFSVAFERMFRSKSVEITNATKHVAHKELKNNVGVSPFAITLFPTISTHNSHLPAEYEGTALTEEMFDQLKQYCFSKAPSDDVLTFISALPTIAAFLCVIGLIATALVVNDIKERLWLWDRMFVVIIPALILVFILPEVVSIMIYLFYKTYWSRAINRYIIKNDLIEAGIHLTLRHRRSSMVGFQNRHTEKPNVMSVFANMAFGVSVEVDEVIKARGGAATMPICPGLVIRNELESYRPRFTAPFMSKKEWKKATKMITTAAPNYDVYARVITTATAVAFVILVIGFTSLLIIFEHYLIITAIFIICVTLMLVGYSLMTAGIVPLLRQHSVLKLTGVCAKLCETYPSMIFHTRLALTGYHRRTSTGCVRFVRAGGVPVIDIGVKEGAEPRAAWVGLYPDWSAPVSMPSQLQPSAPYQVEALSPPDEGMGVDAVLV